MPLGPLMPLGQLCHSCQPAGMYSPQNPQRYQLEPGWEGSVLEPLDEPGLGLGLGLGPDDMRKFRSNNPTKT